jgi:hypothetical protein
MHTSNHILSHIHVIKILQFRNFNLALSVISVTCTRNENANMNLQHLLAIF